MPELDDLQRELYAKDESEQLVMRRKQLSAVGKPLAGGGESAKEDVPVFADIMSQRKAKRRTQFIILGSLAALALIFVAAVWLTAAWRASRQVKDEQISLAWQGPVDVVAGSEVEYGVVLRNDSRVDWNTVELTVELPEGFHLSASLPEAEVAARELTWRLGNLVQGQEGRVSARGRLIGEAGAVAVAAAEVTLTPENFPSGRFTKTAIFSTTIAALPLQVSLDAAATAGSGERIRGVIHVQNLGSGELTGAVLSVAAPPGLELALEDSEFSPGFDAVSGRWDLSPIPSLAEVTRTLVFTVTGQPGERRALDIRVGVREGEHIYEQRQVTHVVTLSASELTIEQAYNGSTDPLVVFPEGKVEGEVRYANVGTVGMRSAVVTLQFEGAGLDVGSLRLSGGAYDPRTRRITWTAASVPELNLLQPGETGTLKFDFSILPVSGLPTAKNLALIGVAAIDSQDLPTPVGQAKKVISDRAVLSLGTQFLLEASAWYDDGRLGITSSGPLPPKVGQTTTYTVRLRLGSALNEVGEVKLMAGLPDGVDYTDKVVVSKGSVDFDERTREVHWDIPLLGGLTGRSSLAEELYFQVAVTPGANLKDRVLPLLSKLNVGGQDTFIEQIVTREVKELPTTETASPGQGQVE